MSAGVGEDGRSVENVTLEYDWDIRAQNSERVVRSLR